MSSSKDFFLEFINSPNQHRTHGKELTPGGMRRYMFWFGAYEGRFIAYKFMSYRTIDQAPVCVITSFSLRDFVQTAKQIGLHITKAERDALAREIGE
jgi:hypothetical protein